MSVEILVVLIIGAIGITVLAYFFSGRDSKAKARHEQNKKLQRIEEIETKAYPSFSNERAVTEMGVHQEVADTLLKELLLQIDETLVLCRKALKNGDIGALKDEIHRITGSSKTLGTGGIANVLEDFFNYLKDESDQEIITAYLNVLEREQRFLLEAIKVQL